MLRECALTILRDERGGGTVFGLLWFALLVGICGLAVDITDGFRNKTMLQATADSAALAAVTELRDSVDTVSTAVELAELNMTPEDYGDVLHPGDVEIGIWDEDAREFAPPAPLSTAPLNAVRVTLNQTSANGNAVAANFLRIMGLRSWDVRVRAVAQAFSPKCLKNGITAAGIVDISSNNGFVKEICVHGEQGVDLQSNNYFETGVKVTMGSLDDLSIPASGMTSNPGLAAALGEAHKVPRLAHNVDSIMADFLDPTSGIHAPYIDLTLPIKVLNPGSNLLTALVPKAIHHVQCPDNVLFKIPAGMVVAKVVIIADCGIQIGSGATLIDVVLGSRSGGGAAGPNKAIITAPAGATIGLPDNCAPGGGVQLFSNATMHFASTTTFNGVQMVAVGDVELGARDMGINGISVETLGNTTLTANNEFGLCQGGTPELRRFFYYRLVR